jgi:hypothetical protein
MRSALVRVERAYRGEEGGSYYTTKVKQSPKFLTRHGLAFVDVLDSGDVVDQLDSKGEGGKHGCHPTCGAAGVELLGRGDVADKLREELDGVHKGEGEKCGCYPLWYS